MKEIEYYRHEFHGEQEKLTSDLISFVYDVPYLTACGVLPPLHILNKLLIAGGGDAGMSPGASWTPFSLNEAEYNELCEILDKTDPSTLNEQARFTDVKYFRDPEFDGEKDFIEWMEKVCAKHRDRS